MLIQDRVLHLHNGILLVNFLFSNLEKILLLPLLFLIFGIIIANNKINMYSKEIYFVTKIKHK